jgi:hypothetical protein
VVLHEVQEPFGSLHGGLRVGGDLRRQVQGSLQEALRGVADFAEQAHSEALVGGEITGRKGHDPSISIEQVQIGQRASISFRYE